MIRHICMFKVAPEALAETVRRAESLHGVKALRRFEAVVNAEGCPDDNFNFAVICDVDDTAALFHVRGSEGEPLLIASSDRDMPCRLEQNRLLVATLRHFEYAAPVHFVQLQGVTHGGMVRPDEDGNVPLLPHIIKFISET